MSFETRVLLELQAVREELGAIRRRLDTPVVSLAMPDLLTTSQARLYCAKDGKLISRETLHRWIRAGKLTDIRSPRRYRRSELDLCIAGQPISPEDRGRRRLSLTPPPGRAA